MQIGDETDQVPWALNGDMGSSEEPQNHQNQSATQPKDQSLTNGPVQIHEDESSPAETSQNDQALSESQRNDLQESFSRFRSRSEGSGLGFPKKGALRKTSEADALKLSRRVSFADSNGFELEHVVKFEVPQNTDPEEDEVEFVLPATTASPFRPRPSGERRFVPYFTLPWNAPGKRSMVFAALEDRKICLETFTIHSSWRISGTILVKNLSFNKRVFVRRSLDKWQTHKDVDATYACSVNENVDRFRFELHLAFKLPPGTRLEIALGYEVPQGRGQYWDNNEDNNYSFWFNDKV